MSQPHFLAYAGISAFELLAIAILSLALILLLAMGRWGWRGAKTAGLALGILCATSLTGLFLLGWTGQSNKAPEMIDDDLYAAADNRFQHAQRLFGEDVAKARLEDARIVYGDFLAKAKLAQLATFPNGESVLIARFEGAARVTEAARAYLQRFRVELATGDLTQGLRGERSDLSDRVELLLDGDVLVVWSARTEAALASRRWASEAGNPLKSTRGNK